MMDKKKQDIHKDPSGELSVAFTQHSESPRHFRRRAGERVVEGPKSHIWLISFTDIMALMLTFFVLLFSMTEPSKTDWAEVTAALQEEFSKFYGSLHSSGKQDAVNIEHIDFDMALNIAYLTTVVQNVIDQNKGLSEIDLIRKKDRLIVSLPHDFLFSDKSATNLKQSARQNLSILGETLASIRNKIEVIGFVHPEDASGADLLYNWQHSSTLASQVAGILEITGYRKDITIRGGGTGRYRDMSSPDSSGGAMRDTMARRVNIVILNHDGRRSKVF